MKFVSFQPKGWQKMKSHMDEQELYYDLLNFHPLYCLPVTDVKVTLVNASFANPSIPEVAVFFEAHECFAVDKMQHYAVLDNHSLKKPDIRLYDAKGKNAWDEILLEFFVDRSSIHVVGETELFMSVDTQWDIDNLTFESWIHNEEAVISENIDDLEAFKNAFGALYPRYLRSQAIFNSYVLLLSDAFSNDICNIFGVADRFCFDLTEQDLSVQSKLMDLIDTRCSSKAVLEYISFMKDKLVEF